MTLTLLSIWIAQLKKENNILYHSVGEGIYYILPFYVIKWGDSLTEQIYYEPLGYGL
jgi:hypothetical protein